MINLVFRLEHAQQYQVAGTLLNYCVLEGIQDGSEVGRCHTCLHPGPNWDYS